MSHDAILVIKGLGLTQSLGTSPSGTRVVACSSAASSVCARVCDKTSALGSFASIFSAERRGDGRVAGAPLRSSIWGSPPADRARSTSLRGAPARTSLVSAGQSAPNLPTASFTPYSSSTLQQSPKPCGPEPNKKCLRLSKVRVKCKAPVLVDVMRQGSKQGAKGQVSVVP